MARMDPSDRRDAIVEAALAVIARKGMATTTVRDVASEMNTSSGLIHHYFDSMDDVVGAAFSRSAERDLASTTTAMEMATSPTEAVGAFIASYGRDDDGAFQLWLDAWAEAARRPLIQAVSRRLNEAWQERLAATITSGVSDGSFRCADPGGAGWRILSLLDGLTLQTIAHPGSVQAAQVLSWAASLAEYELGLGDGQLGLSPR